MKGLHVERQAWDRRGCAARFTSAIASDIFSCRIVDSSITSMFTLNSPCSSSGCTTSSCCEPLRPDLRDDPLLAQHLPHHPEEQLADLRLGPEVVLLAGLDHLLRDRGDDRHAGRGRSGRSSPDSAPPANGSPPMMFWRSPFISASASSVICAAVGSIWSCADLAGVLDDPLRARVELERVGVVDVGADQRDHVRRAAAARRCRWFCSVHRYSCICASDSTTEMPGIWKASGIAEQTTNGLRLIRSGFGLSGEHDLAVADGDHALVRPVLQHLDQVLVAVLSPRASARARCSRRAGVALLRVLQLVDVLVEAGLLPSPSARRTSPRCGRSARRRRRRSSPPSGQKKSRTSRTIIDGPSRSTVMLLASSVPSVAVVDRAEVVGRSRPRSATRRVHLAALVGPDHLRHRACRRSGPAA